ncbi:hypothetical protein [Bradyrhizobium sp. CB3481]|uniref:hypothetical protein n=1 Tax=Bradyrhizobium sp. CB3481 TaxID=3039158 RepID=UPI0024B1C791|nr:hypothetical protein [Bradyrhizobium sp. CB3481]WFU15872.1 hypothetical protein QA643_33720 [Bradyrhizobium sp. CB3481]
MSDWLRESEAGRHQPPHHHTCNHCGGTARPIEILDSRQGKNVRFLRCLSCEKTSWIEEQ